MKKVQMAAIALLIFMVNGCASQYGVLFDSYPKGAALICNGTNWGYTPMRLYYDAKVNQLDTLDVSSCSANWISGAHANYGTFSPKQFPTGVQLTVQRPNVRGLQQDAEFALKVATMQAAQRQAAAAESQASAARAQAAAAQQQAASVLTQTLNANRPRTCFTNYGMTTCY